ncbi:MAG: cytochrome c3 family protein [Bacillota bacterium]|nr:cytochrome c3 family protein [Bacillota bacterium]
MNNHKGKFLLVLLLVGIGLLALAGCGGGSTEEPPSQNQTSSQDNNQQQQEVPVETQIPDANAGGKTVADVMASIEESNYLDATHLNNGLDCSTCHSELPVDKAPPTPPQETCLSCHYGSYEELAKTTEYLKELNPHNSHDGQLDCDWCHYAHEPFNNYCGECHSYRLGDQFN